MCLPLEPNHAYDRCGGPPRCRYCTAILTESGDRNYERVHAENAARGLRTAADTPRGYVPPDPYAADIAKLRQQNTQPGRWPEKPKSSSSPKSYTPPDPYTPHLRKEHR